MTDPQRTLGGALLDGFLDALQTAFRLLPWPTEPGLRRIGSPDPSSPVLLTGNYDLTVRRLVRALAGRDVWLLVAPSGGINVWCAAAGGHLSTHQVVTALKTSNIDQLVNHRRLVLPQLAATGVLALDVFRRSRWQVRFGPVSANDLPEYLDTSIKTDAMRRVMFPLSDRLQMAAQWAAPTSLVLGGAALAAQPAWAVPLVALIAAMSIAVFTCYDRLGEHRRPVLFGLGVAVSVPATALAGGGSAALVAAVIAPALLTAILTFDYAGSTPLEGGSHFEERNWHIALDLDRCQGVYRCWEVCPEACFEKLENERRIELAHDDRCIRCGACVVQCPQDALFFEDASGTRIEPAVIRRFKLNLLGSRNVDSGPGTST
jgi:NAD-dependent dihydropyrimidine dehydrogenase PreA subunit